MPTPAEHLELDLLLAAEMGLANVRSAGPRRMEVGRLVVAVPVKALDATREALFGAGAGAIGTYEHCSFYSGQIATYIPRGTATPTVGVIGEEERIADLRLEVRYPPRREVEILTALRTACPYDENAVELSRVTAVDWTHQAGAVGVLPKDVAGVLADLGVVPAVRPLGPDLGCAAVFTEWGAPVDGATVIAEAGAADYIVPGLLSLALELQRDRPTVSHGSTKQGSDGDTTRG